MLPRFGEPLTTASTKAKNTSTATKATPPTKHHQVIDLLNREAGASLEAISALANWLPHSTRAFLNGLKKKGHIIASGKTDGLRRFRATPSPAECEAK